MGKFVFFGLFIVAGSVFTLIGWSAVKDARERRVLDVLKNGRPQRVQEYGIGEAGGQ